MIIHDSDKIQITEETDETKFLAVDNGNELSIVEVSEKELEDLFDSLVDYFANKAESYIDSETLREMQEESEDGGNVLRLR